MQHAYSPYAPPQATIPLGDYVIAGIAAVISIVALVMWITSPAAKLNRAFDDQGVRLTGTVLDVREANGGIPGTRIYTVQYYDGSKRAYVCAFELPGYERLRGHTFEKADRITIDVLAHHSTVCRLAPA